MPASPFYFVGIAGGSASGKTFFLQSLREAFTPEQVCIISQDDYYRPIGEQVKDTFGVINYDLPTSINEEDFLQDLEKLALGQEIQKLEYVFNNPAATPGVKILRPAPIIVVEGLFIFHFERIREKLDLKIFIEARDDITLARRLLRDEQERGYPMETILHQWHRHVHPAYRRYLLPYRDESDVIITNHYSFTKGLELVRDHLKVKLG